MTPPAAAGRDRRRPPDVPHGAGRGDRRDGRHRARRRGAARRPGARPRRRTPPGRACCSTSAWPTARGSRSTGGWPSTTPTCGSIMLTMSEDHDTALDRAARRRQRLPREGRRARARRARPARRSPPATSCSTTPWPRRSASSPRPAARRRRRPFPQLTDREFDILALVAEGIDNHGDRPPPRAQPEDGPQPRLQRVRQDPGQRPAHAVVLARRVGLGT